MSIIQVVIRSKTDYFNYKSKNIIYSIADSNSISITKVTTNSNQLQKIHITY